MEELLFDVVTLNMTKLRFDIAGRCEGWGIPYLYSKVIEAKRDFFFQCLTDVSFNIVLHLFPRRAGFRFRKKRAVVSVTLR